MAILYLQNNLKSQNYIQLQNIRFDANREKMIMLYLFACLWFKVI